VSDPSASEPSVEQDDVPQTAPEPVLISMPVDVRGLSLTVLAVTTALWVLYIGRSLFVPILIGFGVSLVLGPMVDSMAKRGVPRVLGAALVLGALLAGSGAILYRVAGQATELADELPRAAREVRQLLTRTTSSRTGTMAQIQEAADEITSATASPGRRGVTPVRIVEEPLRVSQYLLSGTRGIAGWVGQVLLVVFLVFFLLTSGDMFKRKLVKLTGPSLSEKKVTVQIIDEISYTISRYLRTVAMVCSIVGVATWLAFLALDMPNAALWGVLAGTANIVPYFGPTIIASSATLAAYLHFDTMGMAVATGGTSLLITGLEGFILTPMLMSRTASMNAVAMFIGILCWGWLWGFWGMLLAVPLLMVLKVIADRVEDLAPVAELLGE
jgi:predicted PurR-regulated permease PerM